MCLQRRIVHNLLVLNAVCRWIWISSNDPKLKTSLVKRRIILRIRFSQVHLAEFYHIKIYISFNLYLRMTTLVNIKKRIVKVGTLSVMNFSYLPRRSRKAGRFERLLCFAMSESLVRHIPAFLNLQVQFPW